MRAFRSNAFSLAREEDATDGKVTKEIEHMFYAHVDSAEALFAAASVEIQEQWGLWHDKTDKNAGSGSVRIRKTVFKGVNENGLVAVRQMAQYVMTTKIRTSSGDALEIPIVTTEDNFKAFRLLAESGMIKHRYIFPIPNTDLKWEVDMFVVPGEKMSSTKYLPWCKIDLEVKDKSAPIPEFPAGFSDAFAASLKEMTDEQKAVVEMLKPCMSLPNPHVTKVYEGVLEAA